MDESDLSCLFFITYRLFFVHNNSFFNLIIIHINYIVCIQSLIHLIIKINYFLVNQTVGEY